MRRPGLRPKDREVNGIRKEQAMSRNDGLMAEVDDELFRDPRVDNAAIAVSADDGPSLCGARWGVCASTATISGTVRSWRERDQAIDAAWAAPGQGGAADVPERTRRQRHPERVWWSPAMGQVDGVTKTSAPVIGRDPDGGV
jgi:hypothetical protein